MNARPTHQIDLQASPPSSAMNTEPNLQDADAFYEQLLDAHLGLDADQSALLNARLILLLANQVGNAQVLTECIEAARRRPVSTTGGASPR